VYDLALKGTPWSWLPFAVGIPLLPVFAWIGTGQPLPPSFAALIPAAGLAGAALAIGNALVDVERDRAAGVTSIAAHLGPARAWRVMAGLYIAVISTAAVTSMTGTSAIVGFAASLVPGAIVLAGVAWSRAREPVVRERGWRLQAAGVALLAAGWLSALLLG
jgi:4-hydroxybenzoate polyprenyltransferase